MASRDIHERAWRLRAGGLDGEAWRLSGRSEWSRVRNITTHTRAFSIEGVSWKRAEARRSIARRWRGTCRSAGQATWRLAAHGDVLTKPAADEHQVDRALVVGRPASMNRRADLMWSSAIERCAAATGERSTSRYLAAPRCACTSAVGQSPGWMVEYQPTRAAMKFVSTPRPFPSTPTPSSRFIRAHDRAHRLRRCGR